MLVGPHIVATMGISYAPPPLIEETRYVDDGRLGMCMPRRRRRHNITASFIILYNNVGSRSLHPPAGGGRYSSAGGEGDAQSTRTIPHRWYLLSSTLKASLALDSNSDPQVRVNINMTMMDLKVWLCHNRCSFYSDEEYSSAVAVTQPVFVGKIDCVDHRDLCMEYGIQALSMERWREITLVTGPSWNWLTLLNRWR